MYLAYGGLRPRCSVVVSDMTCYAGSREFGGSCLARRSTLRNAPASGQCSEQERLSSLTALTTMANTNERAVTFPAWIQGMIDRYEAGQFEPVSFIKQVLDRTVSMSSDTDSFSLTRLDA